MTLELESASRSLRGKFKSFFLYFRFYLLFLKVIWTSVSCVIQNGHVSTYTGIKNVKFIANISYTIIIIIIYLTKKHMIFTV